MVNTLKMLSLSLAALLIAGCASYGAVVNEPLPARDAAKAYSIRGQNQIDSGDVTLILAFSGGGSRAAALAYGVLEELRDTRIMIEGRERPVIDEIDAISSVSGGSFTAAY